MIQHEMFPKLPDDWRVGRLLEVADTRTSNVDKHTVEGQSDIRLCNYVDVYYNEVISGAIDFMRASASPDQIARFRLQTGDTVITKDSETADDIGIPAYVEYQARDLVCGYHLAIVRPYSQSIDPKYLYWVMRSDSTLLQWSVRATGVTRVGIKANDLARATIPIPPRSMQATIAGYLDRETQRIDELIAEQRGLIETLRERLRSVVDGLLLSHGLVLTDIDSPAKTELPAGWQIMMLGSALETLTNGYVGPTRDILVEEGVRYIQGMHIKNGSIDFERRPFFVTQDWHDSRPRINLRAGDVLIVQTGDIGKVAVVPDGFGEASCHALQIARARTSIVDPWYLGAYLGSWYGYNQLKSRATGALHPHLEAGVRSSLLVVPPLPVQKEIVRAASAQTSRIDALIAESEDLIALSLERRAALITAAVTGQIDVRTAA